MNKTQAQLCESLRYALKEFENAQVENTDLKKITFWCQEVNDLVSQLNAMDQRKVA